jgi:23S rRNA (guanosine2251-2'-O)-methyltransferase
LETRFKKNSELLRPDKESFDRLQKLPVVIVLDNVRSGLNVGSVFRTADAFLVSQVILCGITATPPEREVLKTSLGATETVKWNYYAETLQAILKLKAEKYKIYAVEQAENSVLLDAFVPAQGEKYALIFGHEVKGVDEKLIPFCDGFIEVPQSGTKHSLNISVCAGVVLWEFYKKLKLL